MSSMAKSIGSGALFQSDARSDFIRITGQRFDSMKKRLQGKGIEEIGFTKQQFRDHILERMGGKPDGFIRCRFCLSFFGIKDIAADHEIPLIRGGSQGLDNIGYPCTPCNQRKGAMTPTEYLALLQFLETIPFARIDILKRLEISVQLAAGQRSTAAVVGKLKQTGQWKAAQKDILAARKAKEAGK